MTPIMRIRAPQRCPTCGAAIQKTNRPAYAVTHDGRRIEISMVAAVCDRCGFQHIEPYAHALHRLNLLPERKETR